jgi:hypothetical protein
MRAQFVTVLALCALSCAKKEAPQAAAAEGKSEEAAITAEIPATAEARSFAKTLIGTQVSNWHPTGGSAFAYETLTFKPDGTWSAAASVSAGGEDIDCQESGTWKISEATSTDTATMEWGVVKTTCVSRDAGTSQRVVMTILEGGEYKIGFR